MRVFAWLVGVCLVAATAETVAAEDFPISSYEFDWKVAKSGEAKLILRKDEDSTRVVFGKGYETLSMTPEEAVELGTAFGKTAEMSKALKGTKGKTERVKAGKHVVTFQTTDEGSFFLSLRRDEQFSLRSLILDREDAIAFTPHLAKVKAMATFLDKAVDPNAKDAKPNQDPVEAKKAAEIAKANAERSQADALKARADADRAKAEAEKATADAAIVTAKRDGAKAKEELEAAGMKKLVFAKQFLTKDKTIAKKRLTEIVDNFPGTPSAEEAEELIKKLK